MVQVGSIILLYYVQVETDLRLHKPAHILSLRGNLVILCWHHDTEQSVHYPCQVSATQRYDNNAMITHMDSMLK